MGLTKQAYTCSMQFLYFCCLLPHRTAAALVTVLLHEAKYIKIEKQIERLQNTFFLIVYSLAAVFICFRAPSGLLISRIKLYADRNVGVPRLLLYLSCAPIPFPICVGILDKKQKGGCCTIIFCIFV